MEEDEEPTLEIGQSAQLQVGQQLMVVPAIGQPGVLVTYAGRAGVQLADLGLIQYVLNLAPRSARAPDRGMVLDGQGRLVGIIVPDRQAGAPPGHVFAVPAEQARPFLERMGACAPSPRPFLLRR